MTTPSPQSAEAQERETFERAMLNDGYELDSLVLDGSNSYFYAETAWAYRGWQARASLPSAAASGEPAAYLVAGLPSGEPSLCFEDEKGDYGDETHKPVFHPLHLGVSASGEASAAQEAEAPNFCARCGKRLGAGIHTCSLPSAHEAEEAVKLPSTALEVIEFIGSNFDSLKNAVAAEDTRYSLTVHDLLSAFRDLADQAPTPAVEGLTDEQILDLAEKHLTPDFGDVLEFARALLAASPVPMASSAGEPVTVEAVATIVKGADGLDVDWLVEGGICALAEGETLLVSQHRLTDETGSGEVYLAPPAASLREQEPLDDFKISAIFQEWNVEGASYAGLMRMVEKAHGIGLDAQRLGRGKENGNG
jgi:hypothetical protein